MSASLPIYELKTRSGENGPEVWDSIRKQWLFMTPEEQVRQCLIQYLTEVCGVPKGLLSLEKGLNYDRRRKRYDLLVYARSGKPLILCECKEPRVPIDEAVLQQAATYNHKIGAGMILLTNGPTMLAFGKENGGKWQGLEMPDPDLGGSEEWFSEEEKLFD